MSNVDRIEECRISLHHLEFRTDAPQKCRVGPTKSMPSDAFFNSLVFRRWPNVPAQDRVSPARFPAPIPPASEDPMCPHLKESEGIPFATVIFYMPSRGFAKRVWGAIFKAWQRWANSTRPANPQVP